MFILIPLHHSRRNAIPSRFDQPGAPPDTSMRSRIVVDDMVIQHDVVVGVIHGPEAFILGAEGKIREAGLAHDGALHRGLGQRVPPQDPPVRPRALFQQPEVDFHHAAVLERVIVIQDGRQRDRSVVVVAVLPIAELRDSRDFVVEAEIRAEDLVADGHGLRLTLGVYAGVPVERGFPEPTAHARDVSVTGAPHLFF